MNPDRSLVMNIGAGVNVAGLVLAFERLSVVTADNSMVMQNDTTLTEGYNALAGPILTGARDREKARLRELRRATRHGRKF